MANHSRNSGFVHILIALLALLLLTTIGYAVYLHLYGDSKFNLPISYSPLPRSPQPSPSLSPSPTPGTKNVDCDFPTNSTFSSVTKEEGGLGPNGAVMGNWLIYFNGNSFRWGHSDVVESGTYTCKNNSLKVKLFDRSLYASYDSKTGILTWDNVNYKRTK